MLFNYVFLNPPYNVGGKITKATLNSLTEDGICVCLMPLAQYKPKALELWRYVETMNLADNEMFEDAIITNNLSICILRKHIVDKYKSYSELDLESFNANYKDFFMKNVYNDTYFDYRGLIWDTLPYKPNPKTWVALGVRILADGNHDESYDRDWNTGKNVDLDAIRSLRANGKYRFNVFFLVMPSENAKDNYVSFLYNGNAKNNLQYKLMKAQNKNGGSPLASIPCINWETISDHPLWKQGDYDGAVLSVMNLRWNEDKIVTK